MFDRDDVPKVCDLAFECVWSNGRNAVLAKLCIFCFVVVMQCVVMCIQFFGQLRVGCWRTALSPFAGKEFSKDSSIVAGVPPSILTAENYCSTVDVLEFHNDTAKTARRIGEVVELVWDTFDATFESSDQQAAMIKEGRENWLPWMLWHPDASNRRRPPTVGLVSPVTCRTYQDTTRAAVSVQHMLCTLALDPNAYMSSKHPERKGLDEAADGGLFLAAWLSARVQRFTSLVSVFDRQPFPPEYPPEYVKLGNSKEDSMVRACVLEKVVQYFDTDFAPLLEKALEAWSVRGHTQLYNVPKTNERLPFWLKNNDDSDQLPPSAGGGIPSPSRPGLGFVTGSSANFPAEDIFRPPSLDPRQASDYHRQHWILQKALFDKPHEPSVLASHPWIAAGLTEALYRLAAIQGPAELVRLLFQSGEDLCVVLLMMLPISDSILRLSELVALPSRVNDLLSAFGCEAFPQLPEPKRLEDWAKSTGLASGPLSSPVDNTAVWPYTVDEVIEQISLEPFVLSKALYSAIVLELNREVHFPEGAPAPAHSILIRHAETASSKHVAATLLGLWDRLSSLADNRYLFEACMNRLEEYRPRDLRNPVGLTINNDEVQDCEALLHSKAVHVGYSVGDRRSYVLVGDRSFIPNQAWETISSSVSDLSFVSAGAGAGTGL